MQCISCQSEINPQWTHAIEMNICPFCGKHIMDEHLKNSLASLRAAMEALQSYPDQLNDWLLSNYQYIKTDSPQLPNYVAPDMLKNMKKVHDEQDFQERKKFTVKVQTEQGVQEVQAEKIQSEEKTNDFFKRAEVLKTPNPAAPPSPDASPAFQSLAEKTAHHRKMVEQIKKAGAAGINAAGGAMTISPEMLAEADPQAVAEFQAVISGGEIASALPDSGEDPYEDAVPPSILAANTAIAARKGGQGSNAADLLKLQQMHQRVNESRHNFATGANRGKGGFSRSG